MVLHRSLVFVSDAMSVVCSYSWYQYLCSLQDVLLVLLKVVVDPIPLTSRIVCAMSTVHVGWWWWYSLWCFNVVVVDPIPLTSRIVCGVSMLCGGGPNIYIPPPLVVTRWTYLLPTLSPWRTATKHYTTQQWNHLICNTMFFFATKNIAKSKLLRGRGRCLFAQPRANSDWWKAKQN